VGNEHCCYLWRVQFVSGTGLIRRSESFNIGSVGKTNFLKKNESSRPTPFVRLVQTADGSVIIYVWIVAQ
jgi:hypothetical protein